MAMVTIVGCSVATMCRPLVVAKATIKCNVQGVAFAALWQGDATGGRDFPVEKKIHTGSCRSYSLVS